MAIIHSDELSKLIKTNYSIGDLLIVENYLTSQNTFTFDSLPNGLFPAAIVDENIERNGYTNIWVRDNIFIAFAHCKIGKVEVANKTIRTLMDYIR